MSLRPSSILASRFPVISAHRVLGAWKSSPILIALICLALAPAAHAQVTYGGIQTSLAGSWSGPVGVATDTSGNIYVGQYTAGTVIKVNASTHATSTYLSGSLACSPAITLNAPQLMVMDSSNNLYIANQGTGQIVVWSTASNTCKAYYNAAGVFAVALDSSNNIWYGAGGIVGKIAANAASGTSGTAVISSGLSNVLGLAFAPATNSGLTVGDLLVSDGTQGGVFRYTAASSFVTKSTLVTGLNQPFGLMFDPSNNLLVALTGTNNVVKYLAPSYSFSTPVLPYAKGAEGVGADSSGNIFLTAYQGSTVTELCLSSNCANPVINVGSSSSIVSVNLQIAAGTAVTAIDYLDQGISGTSSEFNAPSSDSNTSLCAAVLYATATVCDVDFVFSPKYPGSRYGAVQVLGGSSSILNSVFVGGVGVGPEVAYLPGTQGTVGTSLTGPQGVGVDGFGNVYIANTTGNGIVKVTSGGTQSTIACCTGLTPATLSNPGGLAVDGAGNIYVADYSNSRVIKIPWNGTAYGSASQVLNGLSNPNDVAVDGNGNVYIANEGALQVLKVPWTGTTYGSPVTVENTNRVTGVAVDGNLNVYAAYYYASTVVKIPWNGSSYGTQVSVGSGWTGPFNVSVDLNGNVYVADSIAKNVSVVPWNGTSFGTQYVLANAATNGLGSPTGVSVDAAGDVFIADQTNNRIVKLSDGTAPSLTFKTATNVGSNDTTDGAQAVTIQNIGNAALTISVPSSGTNPSLSSGFAYDRASTCVQLSTVSSAGTLAQGGNCTYAADFIPVAGGVDNGSLVLADNNLNVTPSTQTISLTGTGIAVTQIAWGTVPATPIFVNGNAGSAVTVQEENASNAVVTSATDPITITVTGPNSYSKTYTSTAVAGIATFNLSAVPLPAAGAYTYTASLTGVTSITAPEVVNLLTPTLNWTPTAPTGGTVTGTGTNTVATIPYPTPLGSLLNASTAAPDTSICTYIATPSGGAVTAASVEAPGSYTLTATCTPAGSSVGIYAPIPSTISLTVTKVTPTFSLAPSPNPVALNSSVSVSATLTGGGVKPTGTVTFFDGATQIGTGTLVAGVLTIGYTPTTTGSHSLTVVYGGDTNYLTGTSTAVSEIVVDFSIAAVTPTATVLPGGTATYSLTETPVGSATFPNAIVLTSTGAPASATVTIASTLIAAGSGTTAFTLTVTTANSIARMQEKPFNSLRKMAPFSLALLLLPFMGRMRRRLPGTLRAVILLGAVLAGVAGMSGCGNNSSGYFGHGVTNYTIVVTANSGTLSHSTSVTLTVQ